MASTKISDLGSEIAMNAGEEVRIAALGDGTAKPGDAVGITAAGKVVQTDVGASELFVGFLDKSYKTDIDTAIADGAPCAVIVPRSGRGYRVACTDPTAGVPAGNGHIFSATAGALVGAAATGINTAGVKAINSKALVDTDTVMEIRWL